MHTDGALSRTLHLRLASSVTIAEDVKLSEPKMYCERDIVSVLF